MMKSEMELKDTVELMLSSDYKERFKAEYYLTLIRYHKLRAMLKGYREGTLTFTPKCPFEILNNQFLFMQSYLVCLNRRAKIEGIEL